ncbi:olfactory receptor 2AT4-like [Xyrauchen texanus]|uniref:olfactory receptor 2AT4-like n=1 Tax=Xyrauchen texanus TaxID=154827 RepID=UPI0022424D53|nr:olfactory receptor 2AT4-like [Xyrauchen texanus]
MQSATNLFPNSSFIHPPGFYIVALSSMPYTNIYVIFLAVLYIFIVMFNLFLICIILYDHRLHVPKFMAVGNLAVVDLVLSTSLVPSMINIYLFMDNFVPFNLCLMQMYTYYTFLSLESFSLCILAYDRLIAICLPLRQESINTNTTMAYIIGGVWIFGLVVTAYCPVSVIPLSFCGSVQVNSYFCTYTLVFRLSCSDTTRQLIYAIILTILFVFVTLSFILLTYMSILFSVFRMKNIQSRYKALATCTEHLILVALFFIPILVFFNITFFEIVINPDVSMVALSLSVCITSCVNPIMYSLKTKEIRSRVYALFVKKLTIHPHQKHEG